MRDISEICITPHCEHIINGYGKVVREDHYYAVTWTEAEEGYADRHMSQMVIGPEYVAAAVSELLPRLKELP